MYTHAGLNIINVLSTETTPLVLKIRNALHVCEALLNMLNVPVETITLHIYNHVLPFIFKHDICL